jgi:alpha-glucosidase (family GH31 glycosyl hydrolase)
MMLALVALLASGAAASQFVVAPSVEAEGLYPEWSHYHMVWRNSETSNETADLELVLDYLAHNITVGGTNIDSAWATGFNSFVWDAKKFPSPGAMVDTAHNLGVRVIAWATSMIDSDAPNFAHAQQNGYLVSRGALVKWWHGRGAFLDFTYAPAAAYWKQLMDQVLVNETQLDGFKCDG